MKVVAGFPPNSRLRADELREHGQALPGAANALSAAAALGDVTQTVGDVALPVVTGNVRSVAETKLAVFGLDTRIRFPFGGYAEDHKERAEPVRIAMQRTSRHLGIP